MSQRLQGQSPKNESETRETVSRETESQKVQSTWPVQCGRTSEGFWKDSSTGLSHPTREDDGKVAQPT